jgi:VanZ family protein
MNTRLKEMFRCGNIIPWVLVIIWMAVVIYFSSQVAESSNQVSTGLGSILLKLIGRILPKSLTDPTVLNHVLRKLAHYFAYLILAVLMLNALKRSGAKNLTAIAAAVAVCIVFAAADEIHQLFVSGRTGLFTDVLIDSFGVMSGIVSYLVIGRIGRYVSLIKKGR